jgi:hypothetical protein
MSGTQVHRPAVLKMAPHRRYRGTIKQFSAKFGTFALKNKLTVIMIAPKPARQVQHRAGHHADLCLCTALVTS